MSYLAYDSPLSKMSVARKGSVLEIAHIHWRPCESVFDTLNRMALEEALATTRTQQDAAKLLMVTPRIVCYLKRRWPGVYPTSLKKCVRKRG
jgi:hypothetical protein